MKLKLTAIFCMTALISIYSQPFPNLNSSEIKLGLKKLNILGSVLYVGAHPDDENTAVISYLAKGKLLRTAYLSITRGDGGQNLIGTEQSEQLGVIRTQELLEARKIDGGKQFFTRALDFGYSKSPEETFKIWDKNTILSDVVWIIRKFKPDVIIARFPETGEGGHGHHTASAILASEAFDLANDPNAFPEQLKYVTTWQPKRIFWNAWAKTLENKNIDTADLPTVNVGEYNPLLGKSYTEISALSRSMHKSQGFGSSATRNNLLNYFVLLKGESVKKDLFEEIDFSWNRIEGGEEIQKLIDKAIAEFDDENPSAIISYLVPIYSKIKNLKDEYWKEVKLTEVKELIRSCAGIWIEGIGSDEYAAVGNQIKIQTSIVNRSSENFILRDISVNNETRKIENGILKKGEMFTSDFVIPIADDATITNPYWLVKEQRIGSFVVDDQRMIGLPESAAPFNCIFTVEMYGETIDFSVPLYKRITDPVDGELYTQVKIAPPAVINIEKDLYFFNGSSSKEIKVTIQSFKDNLSGKVSFDINNGWKIEPAVFDFSEMKINQKKDFFIKVTPGQSTDKSEITAKILIDGREYTKKIIRKQYKHIMPQTIFQDSKALLQSYDLTKTKLKKIGYISGSGDLIPNFLSDLGFDVVIFDDKQFSQNQLDQYDAIITGIRAYNTRNELAAFQKELFKYVENGGTLISQYNTTAQLILNPGIFPMKISHDRVTDENSTVKILNKEHKIFNYPYKISENNFKGWIQERGLYFPNEWDEKYETLLSMNDNGESEKLSSILYAKYGKGVFIYTGLSFFREIPAGVEGAIKLFINILHSGI
ncbi:MAG: PIG-L family deacetylase [Ignavibacterium sp.]|jgi:LmbE family N-acetylglucosaminyl deacetylase|nr:PIG-L family deacetylase [Ignavibacterium sp.]